MFIKCPSCSKNIKIDNSILEKYSYFLDDGLYKNGERWDKIRKDIIDIVKNNLKSEVELTEKVDKDIIGGFVLRFKNYQYDTSISHSLSLLRQSFNKNLYIGKINNK